MNKLLSSAVLAVMMTCVVSVTALSQKEKSNDSLACRDNWHSDKLKSSCEIKEQTLLATDSMIVLPWDREVIVDGELVLNPAYADALREP